MTYAIIALTVLALVGSVVFAAKQWGKVRERNKHIKADKEAMESDAKVAEEHRDISISDGLSRMREHND